MSKQSMTEELMKLTKPKLLELAASEGVTTVKAAMRKDDIVSEIVKARDQKPAKKGKSSGKKQKASTPKKATPKKEIYIPIEELDEHTHDTIKDYVIAELRAYAHNLGINHKGMKRAELIDAIVKEADDAETPVKSATPKKATPKKATPKKATPKKASGKKDSGKKDSGKKDAKVAIEDLDTYTTDSLKGYLVADLKGYALTLGIDVAGMKKADLVEAIVSKKKAKKSSEKKAKKTKTPKEPTPRKETPKKKAQKQTLADIDAVQNMYDTYTLTELKDLATSLNITFKSGERKSSLIEKILAEQRLQKEQEVEKEPTPVKKTKKRSEKKKKAPTPKSKTPVREPTPKKQTPVREPTPKKRTPKQKRSKSRKEKAPTPKSKTPVREPTPKKRTPVKEPTPKKRSGKGKKSGRKDAPMETERDDGLTQIQVGDKIYVGTQEVIDEFIKQMGDDATAGQIRKEALKLTDLDFDLTLGVLSKLKGDEFKKRIDNCFDPVPAGKSGGKKK